MARIIGLTGGIASGKSAVSRILRELGAVVIDADEIVHELQAAGSPVLGALASAFGPEILDASGHLRRDVLGEIVFRDPEARRRIGEIMHPPVVAEMARRAREAADSGAPLVVLDVPLLLEGRLGGTGTGATGDYEAVVVVSCSEDQQRERLMARNGLDREEAERRIRSQLPLARKVEMADYVIDNSGDLEATRAQVEALYRALTRPREEAAPGAEP